MAHAEQKKTLRVWTGPVHSGKSKKALTVAKRMVRLGADLVLVRPEVARRKHEPEGYLVTKDGEQWPAIEITDPWDMLEAASGASVLWLDEPSLFESKEEDVYEIVQRVRQIAHVMVSGVPATSELEVFKTSMCRIMAVADEIIWCKADCDGCSSYEKATRSKFKHGPKTEQVHVGGEDDYEALCADCWNKKQEFVSGPA